MRGQAREWWGKLTGDDLEQAEGKAGQLIALLRQKYGYTREKAGREFGRRLEGQVKTVKEKAMADKDEEKAVVEEEEKKAKKGKGKKGKGGKKDKKKGKKKDKKKK